MFLEQKGSCCTLLCLSSQRVEDREATHLDLDDVHDLHTPDYNPDWLPHGHKLFRQRNVLGVSDVQELQLERRGVAVGDYLFRRVRLGDRGVASATAGLVCDNVPVRVLLVVGERIVNPHMRRGGVKPSARGTD